MDYLQILTVITAYESGGWIYRFAKRAFLRWRWRRLSKQIGSMAHGIQSTGDAITVQVSDLIP